MADSIRRGALNRILALIDGGRPESTITRDIVEGTGADGNERMVLTSRPFAFDQDVTFRRLFTGDNDLVTPDQTAWEDIIRESRTPGAVVDVTHTHPPNYPALPSVGDLAVFSGMAHPGHPSNGRGPEFNFGILGTGRGHAGDAFAAELFGNPSQEVQTFLGSAHALPQLRTRLPGRLMNSPLVDEILSSPGGQDLLSVSRFPNEHALRTERDRARALIEVNGPFSTFSALEQRLPDNLYLYLDIANPDREDLYDRIRYHAMRESPLSQGGHVSNKGALQRFAEGGRPRAGQAYNRFNNPFQRRSLEDTRAVNPSWADRVERAEYDEVENMPRPYTMPEVEREITSNLIGIIPGGETGMHLSGREYSGSPPNLPSAVGRDIVNLLTLPMGFVPGMIGDLVGGTGADVIGSLMVEYNNRLRRSNDFDERMDRGGYNDVRYQDIPTPADSLMRDIVRDYNDMHNTFREFNTNGGPRS